MLQRQYNRQNENVNLTQVIFQKQHLLNSENMDNFAVLYTSYLHFTFGPNSMHDHNKLIKKTKLIFFLVM